MIDFTEKQLIDLAGKMDNLTDRLKEEQEKTLITFEVWIKPFGNSAHIPISAKYLNHKCKVFVYKKDSELKLPETQGRGNVKK